MTVGALQPDRDVENRLRTMLVLPQLTTEAYDSYDKTTTQPSAKEPGSGDAPDNPDDANQDMPDEAPNATAWMQTVICHQEYCYS
jgi:hypothetical protein